MPLERLQWRTRSAEFFPSAERAGYPWVTLAIPRNASVGALRYDVIVAGLGAMGSATATHLALRGQNVLGIERWIPGHPNGSSHGDSRIIREMYFEHPMYVPLLQRAYYLWEELGTRTGSTLLNLTGALMIGPPSGSLVTGSMRSAHEHNLQYEMLSPAEVAVRYPAFALRGDLVAVRDPRAGYLDPEACNAAHLDVARKSGADLRFEEPVLSWTADDDGVTVTTPQATYQAEQLVMAVGARTLALMPELNVKLEIERQTVFWFEPQERIDEYEASLLPVYAYEYIPGGLCYGFPALSRGVKASIMHSGEIISDAEAVRRDVSEAEVEPLRKALQSVLPGLASAPVRETATCIFTNTTDHDFIIDFHPAHRRVLVSSACSGHGFKFSSVVGEIQADLIMHGNSRFDLTPFRIDREGLI